jgi:hypothetical protein
VTKRKNGKAASDRPRFEVIGHETIVRRRDLDGDEVESRKAKLRSGYLEERQEKGTFKAFRDFAKPRVDAAFDPKEADLDDESTTVSLDDGEDLEEARGLNDAIEYRKKLAGARVATIKAERRLLLDAIANGYEYVATECEITADNERLEVRYIDPETSEVLDTRAMTDAERQLSLPGDELPVGGAPAAVS